jgi:hypothetical protein
MRNLWLRFLVLATLLFVLPGCDRSSSQIVGKWKVVGDSSGVVWEFADQGKVSAPSGSGRYTFDGKRIKIVTPTATFVQQFEIVDDRMTWKDPSGVQTELTRVK